MGEIPEAMFENRLSRQGGLCTQAVAPGLNLETYLVHTPTPNIDEFKKSFRPQAEMQVKYRLALELSLKKKKKATPDEGY